MKQVKSNTMVSVNWIITYPYWIDRIGEFIQKKYETHIYFQPDVFSRIAPGTLRGLTYAPCQVAANHIYKNLQKSKIELQLYPGFSDIFKICLTTKIGIFKKNTDIFMELFA